MTIEDLKQDADKALAVLAQQPEVNPNKITILGHSEGTMIAPIIAIDNPTKVSNIVLVSAVAQNLREMMYFQDIYLPLLYAESVLDHNHDRLLSVSEATMNPVFRSMIGNATLVLKQNITSTTNRSTTQQLNPQLNTNKDAYISINELKSRLVEQDNSFKNNPAISIWVKSHFALKPTLSVIGNAPKSTGILILQGENDTQTPVQQAFLLQQKLTEVKHPDHTLITYPNLGHVLYPSSQWMTSDGPVPEYVLADLYSWFQAHSGLSQSYFKPTSASTDIANTSSLNTNKTS
jgi:pimeloyl-ACP methyl ester carboxylesterase